MPHLDPHSSPSETINRIGSDSKLHPRSPLPPLPPWSVARALREVSVSFSNFICLVCWRTHTTHTGGMGNLFSCCHPRRKEEEPGSSKTDRLLQDNSTQTRWCGAEEETHGSTLEQPKGQGLCEEAPGILIQQQSGATRGTTRSSSSSSGGSSSGSHPAEPAATISRPQDLQAGHASASFATTARAAAPTAGAQGNALPATSGGHGGAERGAGGMVARGYLAGPSTGANGSSSGPGATAPALPLANRAAGAMPRAHPNDQQRWAAGGGGAHAGDNMRLSGRGGVQKYGGAGATARVGGRFGVGVGGGAGGGGVAGKTVARAVPAVAGTVLAKYEMKEVLGVGSTSRCYRCVNRRSKKEFACKVGWVSAS